MHGNKLANLDDACDGWLLDTKIISAIFGKKPLPSGIAHFFATIPDARLRLSVITVGELRKGVALLPHGATPGDRDNLDAKLRQLHKHWAERIVPVDILVADRWGSLLAEHQRNGKPLPAVDALIAATAYVHKFVVVSHDAVFGRIERIMHYDPYSMSTQ